MTTPKAASQEISLDRALHPEHYRPLPAPQPSTAELQAAPSQEDVGQGEVASAAPAMPVYCHTLAALADEYAEAAARHRTGEKSENYVDTKRAALIAYFAEIEALQAKLERAQAALRVALGDSHELTMPEVRAIKALAELAKTKPPTS